MSPSKFLVGVSLILMAGCTKDMARQPKFLPEGYTNFYADGRQMRPPVEGTVAVDEPDAKDPVETGDGVARIPFKTTLEFLKTGQTRYNIYCTPCHDRTGSGEGIVVARGFQKPESLTSTKIRLESDGELYRAVSFGHGNMYGYRHFLPAKERWAIVGYIRTLQLSQDFPASELEDQDRAQLKDKSP